MTSCRLSPQHFPLCKCLWPRPRLDPRFEELAPCWLAACWWLGCYPRPFCLLCLKILPSLTSSSPQPHFLFVTLKQCPPPIRTQWGATRLWSILFLQNHPECRLTSQKIFTQFDFWKSHLEKADHLSQSWSKEDTVDPVLFIQWALAWPPFPQQPPTLYCLLMGAVVIVMP